MLLKTFVIFKKLHGDIVIKFLKSDQGEKM